ncbi:MAG TPA: pilus assembly protein PilM, partial [Verrucomicrobiae bacterium]|nr:pilus assembly protein PilM [Verrucomicrobiae bacterium]
MKDSSFLNSSSLYIEISQTTLKALKDDSGLEIALERQANGMWSPRCKEQVIGALRKFVDRKQWQPRLRAMCAIGAAGVSLRRVSLPASSKDDFERLLSLQIEAEFPLAPDQLAWGYRRIAPADGAGPDAKQDMLVAAVKKEVVEEYSAVLTACGLNPVFTLAALARTQLVPEPMASGSILEIGPSHSELLTFQDGIPLSVRVLSWGMVNLFQSASGLELLAKSILANSAGPKLYITGPEDGVRNLAS